MFAPHSTYIRVVVVIVVVSRFGVCFASVLLLHRRLGVALVVARGVVRVSTDACEECIGLR